jgi:hypothetical protein
MPRCVSPSDSPPTASSASSAVKLIVNVSIVEFWDKAGLDHNGGLMPDGGHLVLFVKDGRKHIPEAEWEKFLEDQRRLLAERKTAIHHDATIKIDNREVRVQVRVAGDCIYGSTWDSSRLIATTKKRGLGVQGDPVIPVEELKNAKIVVEQGQYRVRFVLQGREIVYEGSEFRVEETDVSHVPTVRP